MNDVSLEGRFKISWDTIEHFYDALLSRSEYEPIRPIRGLINDLRSHGYDQHLRAGQSLYMLVLSRSREHGLRLEQPRVVIEPRDDGGMVVEYRSQQGNEAITLNRIAFCPELQHILDRLLAQTID